MRLKSGKPHPHSSCAAINCPPVCQLPILPQVSSSGHYSRIDPAWARDRPAHVVVAVGKSTGDLENGWTLHATFKKPAGSGRSWTDERVTQEPRKRTRYFTAWDLPHPKHLPPSTRPQPTYMFPVPGSPAPTPNGMVPQEPPLPAATYYVRLPTTCYSLLPIYYCLLLRTTTYYQLLPTPHHPTPQREGGLDDATITRVPWPWVRGWGGDPDWNIYVPPIQKRLRGPLE